MFSFDKDDLRIGSRMHALLTVPFIILKNVSYIGEIAKGLEDMFS